MKKKIFSMHVDVDDFLPASAAEKEYMVKMRPSTTFFKDGMKRLMKNKIAAISMFLIIIIAGLHPDSLLLALQVRQDAGQYPRQAHGSLLQQPGSL